MDRPDNEGMTLDDAQAFARSKPKWTKSSASEPKDDTPAWAYDEDGYCIRCGSGRWRFHMAGCELRDSLDIIRDLTTSKDTAGPDDGGLPDLAARLAKDEYSIEFTVHEASLCAIALHKEFKRYMKNMGYDLDPDVAKPTSSDDLVTLTIEGTTSTLRVSRSFLSKWGQIPS